mmetsp:Transcript_12518/g.31566  ORF Transcript_12518/g.31566 Transcript_12518/m.31566 type:complete len:262 (-) Transcript_12518:1267-2052(-)
MDLDALRDAFEVRLHQLSHAPSSREQLESLIHNDHLPEVSHFVGKMLHHGVEFIELTLVDIRVEVLGFAAIAHSNLATRGRVTPPRLPLRSLGGATRRARPEAAANGGVLVDREGTNPIGHPQHAQRSSLHHHHRHPCRSAQLLGQVGVATLLAQRVGHDSRERVHEEVAPIVRHHALRHYVCAVVPQTGHCPATACRVFRTGQGNDNLADNIVHGGDVRVEVWHDVSLEESLVKAHESLQRESAASKLLNLRSPGRVGGY